MPTNAIGKGTANVPVNLTIEERALLGQVAFQQDISVAELIRRKLLEAFEATDPATAGRIRAVRNARRALILGGIALILWLWTHRETQPPVWTGSAPALDWQWEGDR